MGKSKIPRFGPGVNGLGTLIIVLGALGILAATLLCAEEARPKKVFIPGVGPSTQPGEVSNLSPAIVGSGIWAILAGSGLRAKRRVWLCVDCQSTIERCPEGHAKPKIPGANILCIAALILTACAPQTYGECMRRVEAADPQAFARARHPSAMGGLSHLSHSAVQAWAKCCDLPGVHPEDESVCVEARAAVRRRPPG